MRIIGGLVGVALIVGQGLVRPEPSIPLVLVGVGMLGPSVAKTVAAFLNTARGGETP